MSFSVGSFEFGNVYFNEGVLRGVMKATTERIQHARAVYHQ